MVTGLIILSITRRRRTDAAAKEPWTPTSVQLHLGFIIGTAAKSRLAILSAFYPVSCGSIGFRGSEMVRRARKSGFRNSDLKPRLTSRVESSGFIRLSRPKSVTSAEQSVRKSGEATSGRRAVNVRGSPVTCDPAE